MKKPSFLVYYDNEVIVLRLPDEEAGKLFKSLFPYGREEIKPDFDTSPALAMAFDILSMAIDRDKARYVKRCEANRENGRKGGRPRKTNSDFEETEKSERLFLKPKKADKDKDMDREMDKGMDKDIKDICPEPEPSPDPSGVELPLVDKTFYSVPKTKVAKWSEAYPAVDVMSELKKMASWLDANPTRRKTRRGIDRFINAWLSREQDRGYKGTPGQQASQHINYDLPKETQEMYDRFLGNGEADPDAPWK